jgi:hypothetical protein
MTEHEERSDEWDRDPTATRLRRALLRAAVADGDPVARRLLAAD